MCTCVCIHFYVCGCMCTYVHLCVDNQSWCKESLLITIYFIHWGRVSLSNLSSLIMVNLTSCFALRMPCLHPLWLELQVGHHACPGFAEVLRIQTSCLCGKSSNHWTISPALFDGIHCNMVCCKSFNHWGSLQPYLMRYIVTGCVASTLIAEQSL